MCDFYWNSIDFALLEKDWPRVSAMFDGLLAQDFELLVDLHTVEGFEEYVQSDSYKDWIKKQHSEMDQ